MRKLLLATALLVPGWAYAGGYHDPAPPVVTPSAPVTPSVVVTPAAVVPNGAVTSSSGSSGASASSRSRSSSSSTVNNAVNVSSSGGAGRGENTPDVFAPSISGGNPCAVGGSVGGSGPGAGGLLALLFESDRCSLRQDAALLYNMGYRLAAKNVACQNPWVAEAFTKAGEPCEADVQRWVKAGYHHRADGGWVR